MIKQDNVLRVNIYRELGLKLLIVFFCALESFVYEYDCDQSLCLLLLGRIASYRGVIIYREIFVDIIIV